MLLVQRPHSENPRSTLMKPHDYPPSYVLQDPYSSGEEVKLETLDLALVHSYTIKI